MIRRLLISVCVVLCSCQAFHVSEILDTAERQIVEYPDSALTTMRFIRRYAVLVPQVRARYGVLYSAALDKNYIDVASDSLVRYSADYYDLHGTPEQRMQAYYYLGRTQQNAGEDLSATLSFLDAAQYTDAVDNNYLKGLLYSQLGEMYSRYYNYQKALDCYKASYDYYTAANLPKHQAYQLYEMGRMGATVKRADIGMQSISKAIEMARECEFYELLPYCNMELFRLYELNGEYEQAYSILQQLDSRRYTNYVPSLVVAIKVLYKCGDKIRARELIDRGWQIAKTQSDTCFMHYCLSQIYKFDKQYEKSIDEYNTWTKINNSLISQYMVAADISSIENGFFEQKAEMIKIKAQRYKVVYTLLMVLISALFLVAIFYMYIRTKRKEAKLTQELENQIATFEDIKREVDMQGKEMSAMLHKLMDGQFGMFDELCNAYYERNSSAKQQAHIYNKVQTIIDNFSNDPKTLANLEQIIDSCRDNAMQKLRAELPNLKEDEYKLLCYILAGFSNQAIAVFTKSECGTVATRKSRLKSKIVKSATPNSDYFAELFR